MLPSHVLGARSHVPVSLLAATLLAAGAFATLDPSQARGEKWPAVDPADLHLGAPTVDPGADAEALLWQIRIDNDIKLPSVSEVTHYLRIKIFTDHGKELMGRVDIPHRDDVDVVRVSARTIRPDGATVEVPGKSILERTMVQARGERVRSKSFAFPAVERGSIVEYRWTERRYGSDALAQQIVLQREIPVKTIELLVRATTYPGFQFRMRWFNMPSPDFAPGPDGFQRALLTSTNASLEEPFMPPASAVSPWAMFYYSLEYEPSPPAFWRDFARSLAKDYEGKLRADGTLRAKASEVTSGAVLDREKVERLYDFCRAKIRNLDLEPIPGREGESSNQAPSETLKRGSGHAGEVNLLFATIVREAGMQSRMIFTADRSRNLFDSTLALPGFLDATCVGVWVGLGWMYFDPGSVYMPAGMLPWWEEGQDGLVLDVEQPRFIVLPIAPADSSRGMFRGTFRLAADGSLEGTAVETFTGHWSEEMKERVRPQSAAEREHTVRGVLEKQYPGAIVDSLRLQNVDDPLQPFIGSYHIRIPTYAPRVGSRLLPALSFFEHGAEAKFKETTRRYPIHFTYPYSTDQTVDIELPDSFEVESTPETAPFTAAGLARQQQTVLVSSDGRRIRLHQSAAVCDAGTIAFPQSEYQPIKSAFERMREQSEYTASLRHVQAASSR